MPITRRTLLLRTASAAVAVAASAILAFPAAAGAADKIQVLIIDGQNNHNWKDTSPFLKAQLEKTGRFVVDISTTPPGKAKDEEWDAWKPDFSACDVVLSNYNGPKWPAHVREGFEAFIRGGGGLVNVHAANNAHNGWPGFEAMTGLLWRNNKHGGRIYLDDAGKTVRQEKGEGPGAGHGPQHAYTVITRDAAHPIMAGIPTEWMHAKDELYHGQRGPAQNLHILATAHAAKGGTGVHEPMVWWIPYGEGRCVTNLLGHVNRNDSSKMPAMRCVGFLTLTARSCEWAATGKVTLGVPKDFPGLTEVSLVEDDK